MKEVGDEGAAPACPPHSPTGQAKGVSWLHKHPLQTSFVQPAAYAIVSNPPNEEVPGGYGAGVAGRLSRSSLLKIETGLTSSMRTRSWPGSARGKSTTTSMINTAHSDEEQAEAPDSSARCSHGGQAGSPLPGGFRDHGWDRHPGVNGIAAPLPHPLNRYMSAVLTLRFPSRSASEQPGTCDTSGIPRHNCR